ncbi:hypothetical protein A3Q56_06081 [Intoshia linei]|uniref:Protein kinase domain-containing protein n=1 Tax=Intoshia linei TaxID=1819745 RepID=A0A177AWG1_9BILA|nr:hypothetical protein A3Q56_06081 [Intoshia linei]
MLFRFDLILIGFCLPFVSCNFTCFSCISLSDDMYDKCNRNQSVLNSITKCALLGTNESCITHMVDNVVSRFCGPKCDYTKCNGLLGKARCVQCCNENNCNDGWVRLNANAVSLNLIFIVITINSVQNTHKMLQRYELNLLFTLYIYGINKFKDNIGNLREIFALKSMSKCKNIINIHEIIFEKENGTVYLILELFDMNLYQFMQVQKYPLKTHVILKIVVNVLKALEYMHRFCLFHRDIKPENILIKNGVAKLGDFGSVQSMRKCKPLTEYISTRWYRSPECLLTCGQYNYKMDIWSMGCVTFELITFKPLFAGRNELDQISLIHTIFGPDNNTLDCDRLVPYKTYKKFREKLVQYLRNVLSQKFANFVHFISFMCIYDAQYRPSAKKCLQHYIFRNYR